MSDLYGDPAVEWAEANAANDDGEAVVRDQMLEAEYQYEEDRRAGLVTEEPTTLAGALVAVRRRTLAEGGHHKWPPMPPEWPYDTIPHGRRPQTPGDLYEALGAVAEALPMAMRGQFADLIHSLTIPAAELTLREAANIVRRWRTDAGYAR